MDRIAIAAALWLLPVPLFAQWLHLPAPGIPRTADGKPNLAAPAPRTRDGKPDLSGIWHPEGSSAAELLSASGGSRTPPALGSEPPNRYFLNVLADFDPGPGPLQPAALKAFSQLTFVSRGYDCLPIGMPLVATDPGPMKIVQTPGLIMMLIEAETTFRQIFTDGRKLPGDPQPSWLGSSVGRWDGDMLVVDTAGLNSRTWLDAAGHKHSEQLRVTERFHRVNFGRMDLQLTLDDPETFTQPVSFKLNLLLLPDTDLIESFCAEDEKDMKHVKIQ